MSHEPVQGQSLLDKLSNAVAKESLLPILHSLAGIRLTDDQVRFLLQEYFGEATPKNFARCKLMWPMSEIHEAMWGTTQTGISKLDEDFQGYADLWFGRVRQHITDLRWDRWLKDVAAK
jgi:hypothetical protein